MKGKPELRANLDAYRRLRETYRQLRKELEQAQEQEKRGKGPQPSPTNETN